MRSRGISMPRLLLAGSTLLATIGILMVTPSSASHGGTHTQVTVAAGAGATTTAEWDASLSSDDIIRAVGITPDGSRVVAIGDRFDPGFGSNDLIVASWDTATGGAGNAPPFSPDWINLEDGPAVGFEDNARSLEFSADSSTVYVVYASENVVGVNVSLQTTAVAYDTGTGANVWGPTSYAAFGGFSREMPYGSCMQGDDAQLFIVGQTISSLPIARPPVGGFTDATTGYDPAVASGAAQAYIVAVDTATGAQNWNNAYISDGTVVDNVAQLGAGYQPGLIDCVCDSIDFTVIAGATDVNRFNDGDDHSPGSFHYPTDGVMTFANGGRHPADDLWSFAFSGTERAVTSISYAPGTIYTPSGPAPLGTIVLGALPLAVTAGTDRNGVMMHSDWREDQSDGYGSTFFFFSALTFGRGGEGHRVGLQQLAAGDPITGGGRGYFIGTRRPLAADPQTSRLTRLGSQGLNAGITAFTTDWPLVAGSASRDFGGDSLLEPDWVLADALAPAVFPLSGERLYLLRAETIDSASANNFDGGVDAVDSSLVSLASRIVAGSLEDGSFDSGMITSNSLYDGPDTPSQENLRFAYDNSALSLTFTRADWEHDVPSSGLLNIVSLTTGPNVTSQFIAVGVTEVGSSRFTVILYTPDVPVPATVSVTDPSGTPPVPVVDDTTTAYVGLNADVLVALGDFALGFDIVQTMEEAVYVGRDGVRELLLAGGPGPGTYSGTWRSSRANLAPAAIPAACAATEGLHSLDGEAVDSSGLSGFGSLAIDVDNQLFTDVDCLHFAFLFINACKRSGISAGFPAGDYKPANLVNRGTMSVFTARVVSYNKVGDQTDFTAFVPPACVTPGVPPATFSDVPCAFFAYKHIYYLVANSVAAGTTATTYGPNLLLRRNAMAVFMAKAKDFADNEAPTLPAFVPPICGSESFPDVGCLALFYKEIEYIRAHLITTGFGDGTYRPTALVDRAAMSVMLIRTTGDESDQLPFPVVAF